MRTLIMFTITDVDVMFKKGNAWYARSYGTYFDKVFVLYIIGRRQGIFVKGNTTLVPLGTGHKILDLIFSPYRIYKFAKKNGPSNFLTADSVFLWWTSFLIRFLLKAKVYFMPVCMPVEIYKHTKRAMYKMPMFIEKIFVKLSFIIAYRVIVSRNTPGFIEWLQSLKYVRHKLRVVDMIVEEMPTIEFYESLEQDVYKRSSGGIVLLYVGRLSHEKKVEDLIKMFDVLQRSGKHQIQLWIIGDGPERNLLESLAAELKLTDRVKFYGFKKNNELFWYYKNADIFISPLTGTSLREAALCGLPVIAYNIDWLKGFLVHEKTALLVEYGDVHGLVDQVARLLLDKALAAKISAGLRQCASERWDRNMIAGALAQTFGGRDERS